MKNKNVDFTIYKGAAYFHDLETARVYLREIIGRKATPLDTGTQYPQARTVLYGRGHAIQYRISGPYYPELEAAE